MGKRKSMIGPPIKASVGKPAPKKCIACNGSGRYDAKGSPKCGACNGTGEPRDD